MLKETSSVRSVPGLYNEDQLPLRDSLETAVTKAGGWCKMGVSLRGCEPGSRGISMVESVDSCEKP
jgi:hypothetical protein